MKNLLLSFLGILFLAACSRRATESLENSQPIVYSWDDTTKLRHIQGSLAYINKDNSFYGSTAGSWKAFPYRSETVSKAGDNITGQTNIIVGTDGYKLSLMKNTTASQTAPTDLGANSTYLQIGGGEWNSTSNYRMIGLGYVIPFNAHPPAQMGYQETSKSSYTQGDLVFATRAVTTNTAPTIRFRITAAGNTKSYGPITAMEDVATKGYVDSAYRYVKTFTGSGGTINLIGTQSKAFVNSNQSGAVNYILPPLKVGASYTIWKIGTAVHTITGPITDAGKVGTKVVSDAVAGGTITFVCAGSYWVITAKNGVWTTQ